MASNFEELLQALLNGETVDIQPRSRMEAYLKSCCEGCGCDGLPEPVTRADALLYALSDKLAGGGAVSPDNLTNALITGSITEITNDAVDYIKPYTFMACSKMTTAKFTKVSTIGNNAFYACGVLEKVDFSKQPIISNNCFQKCTSLSVLVLRAESGVCELSNINAFSSTPFAEGGTGGTVYVPAALIDTYKSASNWSALYAAGTCNFVAIEGSEYE